MLASKLAIMASEMRTLTGIYTGITNKWMDNTIKWTGHMAVLRSTRLVGVASKPEIIAS